MVVASITARRSRGSGDIAITFEVEAQTWANIQRSAQEGANPDTLDYVARNLNTAFEDDQPLRETGPPPTWDAKSIKVRRGRKTGPVMIAFKVEVQTWANMRRSADDYAHFDTLDYMAGRLNVVFQEDEPWPETKGPPVPSDMDDDLPF